MLKDFFDVVVMLTESDLTIERPANRFHWARMFRDSGLEVVLVQPKSSGPNSFSGLEGITFLYGGEDAFRGKAVRKILKSNKRILFWNYGTTYSDVIPRDRGFLVHHASEDYLSPTFPWKNSPQKYLGDLIRIMSRANLVVSVSQGVFDNVSRILNQDVNHVLICNAYDQDTFYTEQLPGPKDKQFIFQGGVNERLDWEFLFRLSIFYPDFRFVFYGSVDLPVSILRQMPSNFELCGQVSVSDLRIAMNKSTAALIPFKDKEWLRGSLPLKTFEYLACSLPIFSSPIDSVMSIPSGVREISSLIPRQEVINLSADELMGIKSILDENTYASRMTQLNTVLQKICSSEKINKERLRICVIYDPESLHVNTIKEHLLSLYCLAGFEVYFLSSRARINSNFDGFDVIIVHYSVRLCYEGHLPSAIKRKIASFKGLKCAFLQDEYDQTNVAVKNLLELGVMLVFTCVKESRVNEVYESLVSKGVKFKQVLTGFAFLPNEKEPHIKKTLERKWDLGYRGRRLSHRYGTLGYDKWRIGELANSKLAQNALRLNISSETVDRIYGESWFDFLGNCKAVLGTESGANVFDFDGSLELLSDKQSKMEFVDFQEIYLKDLEIEGLMNQISPRIFEAISTKTALVLYPGEYSGILKPWIHYFQIEKDFSNYSDLVDFLKDDEAISQMAERCYKDIVLSRKYSRHEYVSIISASIQEVVSPCAKNRSLPVRDEFRDSPSNFDRNLNNFWLKGGPMTLRIKSLLYKISRFLWRRIPIRIRYRLARHLPRITRALLVIEESFRKIFRAAKI
jgi:hypothetical protein